MNKARCKLCLKDFDIGAMGESALRSHASSKLHKSLVCMSSHTTVVADFLSHTSTANTSAQSSVSSPGDKVYFKIDIGFVAEKSLKCAAERKKKKAISDKELMQFQMECKEFLVKLVKKVMEKSPLKFSLARSMSSLDPQEMTTAAKETNLKKFKAVLTAMNEANRVADTEVDEVLQQ